MTTLRIGYKSNVTVLVLACTVWKASAGCNFSCPQKVVDEAVKLDARTLDKKLKQKEISNLKELIAIYGEPFDIEVDPDDCHRRRVHFEIEPRTILVVYVDAATERITGHSIALTYQ